MIISAYLSDETVQKLTAVAKQAKISRNALISCIINEWLDDYRAE